ncbi:winged helix-turn-helix transcriptional regulator [Candidatus Woesearchaeota archaeon]|nr:winged helix-turn-helix transcriptional regulator [Candidatus Woesearchaeota archaeon]
MKNELLILKALADETRLKIVELLIEGEKCVCEIFPYIKRTQSTISLQLEVLKKAGILDSKKQGRKVYYFISNNKIYSILELLGIKTDKKNKNNGNNKDYKNKTYKK